MNFMLKTFKYSLKINHSFVFGSGRIQVPDKKIPFECFADVPTIFNNFDQYIRSYPDLVKPDPSLEQDPLLCDVENISIKIFSSYILFSKVSLTQGLGSRSLGSGDFCICNFCSTNSYLSLDSTFINKELAKCHKIVLLGYLYQTVT